MRLRAHDVVVVADGIQVGEGVQPRGRGVPGGQATPSLELRMDGSFRDRRLAQAAPGDEGGEGAQGQGHGSELGFVAHQMESGGQNHHDEQAHAGETWELGLDAGQGGRR